jgi:predicted MFS family arabinose efflux permease
MGQADGISGEFARAWLVVFAATIGTVFGVYGISFYSFGVFIGPLAHDFGWSLSAVTAWVVFWSLGQMVTQPLIGLFTDRCGARATVLFALPLFALALASVSLINGQIWIFYLIALVVGVTGTGVSLLTYGRIINGWFRAGRGTALGIVTAGTGISAIFAPRLMQAVADRFGWRTGFLLLGVIALLVWPLMAAWLREHRDDGESGLAWPTAGYGVGKVVRMPAFWLTGAALLLANAAIGANVVIVPFLSSGGLTRAEASTLAGLLGLFTMVGNFGFGFAIDRLPVAFVLAGALALQALAYVVLGVSGVHYAALAIPVVGVCVGGVAASGGYCIARYFGLKAYGQVFGLLGIAIGAGIAAGPVVFSRTREATGDYEASFLIFAGVVAVAAALFALLGRCRAFDEGVQDVGGAALVAESGV